MFSILKYELVKALHESVDGYTNDGWSDYDNNIGECYERFFVAGCLYENGDIKLPCFGCEIFYRTPEQYHLIKSYDGYRVVDENGFGFPGHSSKEEAIEEAIKHLNILRIQILDMICDDCHQCGCC